MVGYVIYQAATFHYLAGRPLDIPYWEYARGISQDQSVTGHYHLNKKRTGCVTKYTLYFSDTY